jgi:hypothetical protein
MKRRDFITGLGAIGILALTPGQKIIRFDKKQKLHFVGLGSGGTNVARYIQQKGVIGDYTCITWFPSMIEPIPFDPEPFEPYPFIPYEGFNHIDYEYPREFRQSNELGRKRIPLTREMKSTLSHEDFYVVFVGLGAFTGTSLISDVVEFLEARKANYLAICSLPFKNEGRTRNEYARQKMAELEKQNRVKFFDKEEIRGRFGYLSTSKLFEKADEEIYCIFQQEYKDLKS